MYYEEFDKREEEKDSSNNEYMDDIYEELKEEYPEGSDDEPNKKPPKKSGKGPFIALIAIIIVLGLGICGVGGYLILSNIGQTDKVITQEQETEAEADIGSTKTGTTDSSNYKVADVSGVVDEAMPSVVAITSTTFVEQSSGNDFYDFYFGGDSNSGEKKKQEQVAAGSGFIVDQKDNELLIVTNNHVVEDSDKLAIQFYGQKNKETVQGYIKGTNEKQDVAVVAVKMKDIPAKIKSGIRKATLGDSESVKVGSGAVAIGNALGFGQSVTSGVISAVDRTVEIDGKKMTLLQTDAAINGGNSGGALLNQKGEVIGINVAKYSSSGYSSSSIEGMGFAIPISSVKTEINKLEKQQTRAKQTEETKGYLGIKGQTVDSQDSETYSIPKGVMVREVFDDEGADNAGIKTGDVITELDGRTIESMEDLTNALDYYKAGETVKVKVAVRDDGYKTKNINVKLGKQSTNANSDNDNSNNNSNDNSGNNYNNGNGYDNGNGYGNEDDGEGGFSFPW